MSHRFSSAKIKTATPMIQHYDQNMPCFNVVSPRVAAMTYCMFKELNISSNTTNHVFLSFRDDTVFLKTLEDKYFSRMSLTWLCKCPDCPRCLTRVLWWQRGSPLWRPRVVSVLYTLPSWLLSAAESESRSRTDQIRPTHFQSRFVPAAVVTNTTSVRVFRKFQTETQRLKY